MRSILAPALTAALAVSLSACSGGSEVTPTPTTPVPITPSPTPVAPEVYAAAAQQAVQNSLLRVEDLGEGWSPAPPDEDEDFDPQFEGDCAQFNEDAFPGEIATADSEDFTGPDDREVSSSATVVTDAAAAEAGVDLFASFIERCTDQLDDEFTRLFVESLEEEDPFVSIDNLEIDVTPLFAGLFGDRAEGWRIKIKAVINDQPFEFTIDQVVIRTGAIISSVTFQFTGQAELRFEDQISTLITTKAAAADGTLPR